MTATDLAVYQICSLFSYYRAAGISPEQLWDRVREILLAMAVN